MKRFLGVLGGVAAVLLLCCVLDAQQAQPGDQAPKADAAKAKAKKKGAAPPKNEDETKVPKYSVPDPLTLLNGDKVTSVKIWEELRRPEVVKMFEEEVYGRSPPRPEKEMWEVVKEDRNVDGGKFITKTVVIYLLGKDVKDGPTVTINMKLPNIGKAVPVIIGLGDSGGAKGGGKGGKGKGADAKAGDAKAGDAKAGDGKAGDAKAADAKAGDAKAENAKADAKAKGAKGGAGGGGNVPEMLFARGWGSISVSSSPSEGTDGSSKWGGLRKIFGKEGQTESELNDWSTLGAAAWTVSRAVDYLVTDKDINPLQICTNGVSRNGKFAVWASAMDQRIAIGYSGSSGMGGISFQRREFGETIWAITNSFPSWFTPKFATYKYNANILPVDWHEIVALHAPRPFFAADHEQSLWTDPTGAFVSCKEADSVYALYGMVGIGNVKERPPVHSVVGDRVGYCLDVGGHGQSFFDSENFVNFAERNFARPIPTKYK